MHQGEVFLLTKGLSGRGDSKGPSPGAAWGWGQPGAPPDLHFRGERKTVAIASSGWR